MVWTGVPSGSLSNCPPSSSIVPDCPGPTDCAGIGNSSSISSFCATMASFSSAIVCDRSTLTIAPFAFRSQ